MKLNIKKDSFCKTTFLQIGDLIQQKKSFSVIGVAGSGISIFLNQISENFPNSVLIDNYALTTITQESFFKLVYKKLGGNREINDIETLLSEIKLLISASSDSKNPLLLILPRFDRLKPIFTQDFFDRIRAVHNSSPNQLVLIFGVCTNIHKLAPELVLGSDTTFYSSVVYLPLYNNSELKKLISVYGPSASQQILDSSIKLSGGHFQLLQLLIRSEHWANLAEDEFINLVFKNITDHLSYRQLKLLQKISTSKNSEFNDEFLIKTGLLKKTNTRWEVFSPLYANYLIKHTKNKLPVKENRLFKLLKRSFGVIITRESIFNEVWKDDQENATDWALDALVYRLRRNPVLINSGYIIENHKKQGYSLIKN